MILKIVYEPQPLKLKQKRTPYSLRIKKKIKKKCDHCLPTISRVYALT